jgi:hypothetical protein
VENCLCQGFGGTIPRMAVIDACCLEESNVQCRLALGADRFKGQCQELIVTENEHQLLGLRRGKGNLDLAGRIKFFGICLKHQRAPGIVVPLYLDSGRIADLPYSDTLTHGRSPDANRYSPMGHARANREPILQPGDLAIVIVQTPILIHLQFK